MGNVLIQSSTLTGIADAIRAKDGSTAQMYPSEMAGKIAAIETMNEEITVKIKNSGSSARYLGYLNNGVPTKVSIAKGGTSTITVRKGELITFYCSSVTGDCSISSVTLISPTLSVILVTIPTTVEATNCTLTIN